MSAPLFRFPLHWSPSELENPSKVYGVYDSIIVVLIEVWEGVIIESRKTILPSEQDLNAHSDLESLRVSRHDGPVFNYS